MDSTEQQRTQELIDALKARLHERELQKAQFGVSADPIITNEIRQIKAQLRRLEHRTSPNEATAERRIHSDHPDVRYYQRRLEMFRIAVSVAIIVVSFTAGDIYGSQGTAFGMTAAIFVLIIWVLRVLT